MKKLFVWILVLGIVMTAACAGGETMPDLYDLYGETEEGRMWVGFAIPILDGVQLTSSAGLYGDPSEIDVWDGANLNSVFYATTEARGKLLVLLSDMEDKTPGIPMYYVVDTDQELKTGDLIVRSGDSMGSRINRAVYDAVPITWQEMDCLLLTLSGDTPLGSALQTREGELAGLVVAQYAEGENRYIALSIAELRKCLDKVADKLSEESDGISMAGYTVNVENTNTVTFDWSGVELPEIPEGKALFHVVADLDSDYLTYLEITPGDKTMVMFLTPGRTYVSGFVMCDKGTMPDLPEQYRETTVPEAEPLTEYSFHSEIFAIGDLAEDAPASAMPTVPEEITEEFLRSGRSCIYSVTSYDVDKIIDSLSLLVTLTSPEGSNYRWESYWIYHPSYEQRDEWYERISDSGLLDMLNENGYPEGEYEMCIYIDGKLADTFTFTLKK